MNSDESFCGLFSSIDGFGRLRQELIEALTFAASLAQTSEVVAIQIMIFAFTDHEIAKKLITAAKQNGNLRVMILADWSQGSPAGASQVRKIENLNLPNVQVRYTLDEPYSWNTQTSQLCWSYRQSLGLFHHKSFVIIADDVPVYLSCGSFNWSKKASSSYENMIVWRPGRKPEAALADSFSREFDAIWRNAAICLERQAVNLHYTLLRQAMMHGDLGAQRRNRARRAHFLTASSEIEESTKLPQSADGIVAFSTCGAHDGVSSFGYHPANANQWFASQRGAPQSRSVHVSITNLALEVIETSRPGDRLCIAMYAISRRTPEYERLLGAARRGVRIDCVVDRDTCKSFLTHLSKPGARNSLPISIKASGRMMHQKYILNASTGTVAVGTANMTVDSVSRHAENRILFRNKPHLAERFRRDFDSIWGRLQYESRSVNGSQGG